MTHNGAPFPLQARTIAPAQRETAMRLSPNGPWGALWQGDATQFRLWAPRAHTVEVVLCDQPRWGAGEQRLTLERCTEGWHRLVVDGIAPGTFYGFSIDGAPPFPDPASRFQPSGVHAPSMVVDMARHRWQTRDWRPRPWAEAVIYELHVGTFTPEGTYDGVRGKLPHLAALGVTAIELMPLASFSGTRGWGYDGVLPYAPTANYGTPDDLKALIDEAHGHGIMVFLDVVYNHFGPDGNYLHGYIPDFFDRKNPTPWGDGIDFSRRAVRDYFIQNAITWLEDFRFDGLRFDAVQAIRDTGPDHFLEELAGVIHARTPEDRTVHLILENGDNAARYLRRDEANRPRQYTAQWNDDIHHAFHVTLTGETAGYYADYAEDPLDHLGRCLAQGFTYQGQKSAFTGAFRGEPSGDLPASAFIAFLQNHDQVGNRAMGERIGALASREAIEAGLAVLLLSPQPPMLFMGEEWDAPEPFPFFCDFHGDLARAVRKGRRREFAAFPEFSDREARKRIPDPNARETFDMAVLDWSRLASAAHADRLRYVTTLLQLRRERIMPHLRGLARPAMTWVPAPPGGLALQWLLDHGGCLSLIANLHAAPGPVPAHPLARDLLFTTHPEALSGVAEQGVAPPWYVAWTISHPETDP